MNGVLGDPTATRMTRHLAARRVKNLERVVDTTTRSGPSLDSTVLMSDEHREILERIQERERAYKAKPRYRVHMRVVTEGYGYFHTDGDPNLETEDDDVASDLIEQVLDDGLGEADVDRWGEVEQQLPGGGYGAIDWDAVEERANQHLIGQPICASIGPRIGREDGRPRCKFVLNHPGFHRPHPNDGWEYGLSWGDPLNPDLELREEYLRQGLRPMTEEEWH